MTRSRADGFAVLSQERLAKAYADGLVQQDLVPVALRSVEQGWGLATQDEQPRPGTTVEGLSDLRTPFRPHGHVTAGNAAGLNDGATGCLIAAEDVARELGLAARMRLVGYSFAGVEPEVMGVGPIPATEQVLRQTGLSIDDIGLIEINEAFAVQVLAFLDHFGIDDDDPRVNPLGRRHRDWASARVIWRPTDDTARPPLRGASRRPVRADDDVRRSRHGRLRRLGEPFRRRGKGSLMAFPDEVVTSTRVRYVDLRSRPVGRHC